MAKESKAAAAESQAGRTDTKKVPVGPETCRVVMNRAVRIGELELAEGVAVAEVKLATGVSLPWLARAVSDGLAGA